MEERVTWTNGDISIEFIRNDDFNLFVHERSVILSRNSEIFHKIQRISNHLEKKRSEIFHSSFLELR